MYSEYNSGKSDILRIIIIAAFIFFSVFFLFKNSNHKIINSVAKETIESAKDLDLDSDDEIDTESFSFDDDE